MHLWISVHLTQLSLDALSPPLLSLQTEPAADLRVVIDHDRAVAMTPDAAAEGVRPGMRRGGVTAVAPHALLLDRDPVRENALLNDTALALLQYTPEIAHADDHSLLLNVGASLLAFGGPLSLSRKIRLTLSLLGCQANLAMAPTAQGAWLLARSHRRMPRRTLKPASLQRRLATLPCTLIVAARPYKDWLDGIGCRTFDDLQRLPRNGLQKRCGKDVLLALDLALGRAPEIFEWIQAPPIFHARFEPVHRIEHAGAVLAIAQRLIQQMAGWLSARHHAVSRIELSLEHERGRHARAPTQVVIALAEATWHGDHLVMLLKERLAHLVLRQPAIAVGLRATEIVARAAPSDTLFTEPGGTPADHRRLLELLEARLGADNVLQPQPRADHLPEVANQWTAANAAPQRPAAQKLVAQKPAASFAASASTGDRPFWLLEKPLALQVRHHRPFHVSALRLLDGPERIESGWWNGRQARRDYFIAESDDSARYWIYRERTRHDVRWFLHGLFA